MRRAIPPLLVVSALGVGCNLLTGVGSLEVEEGDASVGPGPVDGAGSSASSGATSSSSASSSSGGSSSSSTSSSSSSSTSSSSSASSSSSGSSTSSSSGAVDSGVDARPAPLEGDYGGHHYKIVVAQLSWSEAKLAAEKMGGHLATITTAGENEFCRQLVVSSGNWTLDGYGPWLGGYKVAGGATPADGWKWVTDETWAYVSWVDGEPNDSDGVEDYLGFFGDVAAGGWNDYPDVDGNVLSYLVELEP